MSSSRSDDVTKSVSVLVWSHFYFSFEHSQHLKQDVLSELQGCLFEALRAFQGSFKDVSKKF